MPQNSNHTRSIKGFMRPAYLITLFALALTGFGQMPIFKRYYIADIPGLAWLAEFFVTHYIHYLAAILFLALAGYWTVDYLLSKRSRLRLTTAGYVRGTLLAAILTTGIFLVIRNLAVFHFAPALIIFLDLSHLGAVMAFLFFSLYCLIFKKRWTTAR